MRPIKLKIKGLNSFIEEQEINFEKLTSKGLFGIFGPTGSGKSTVLDGITLALYGDISRKSTNFINTNCDSMNVSFEFQITSNEIKRYRVTREFKRDKKNSNPKTGKCKIVDITDGDIILAEKVREVTDKCSEIIGLSLEDFTRTVVIPQGKFSDFLKLEGKSRREMLERLFNLEKYGDNLLRKLGSNLAKVNDSFNIIEGELKGYEGVTAQKITEVEEEFNISKVNLEKVSEEFQNIQDKYKEASEVYNIQKELESHLQKENELIEKKDIMEGFKKRIVIYESINRVIQTVKTFEKIEEDLNETQKLKNNITSKVYELEKKKIKLEEEWNNARDEKEKNIPILKIKQEKIKEAISEKELSDKIKNKVDELENFRKKLLKKKEENNEELNKCTKEYEDKKTILKEKEKNLDSLELNEDEKKYVQEGVLLFERINNIKTQIEIKEKRLESLNKQDTQNKDKLKVLEIDYRSKKENYQKQLESLKELTQNKPLEQNQLLKLQKDINYEKEQIIKKDKNVQDIKDYNIKIENEKKNLLDFETEKQKLDQNVLLLEVKIKSIEQANLAKILRMSLKENSPCPVCGSIHHDLENYHLEVTENEELENLKKSLDSNLESLKEIEKQITISNTKIKQDNENLKNLISESKDYENAKKIEEIEKIEHEFNHFVEYSDKYNAKKKLIDENLEKLKEECYIFDGKVNNINVTILEGSKGIKELRSDINTSTIELNSLISAYSKISLKTGISDFLKRNNELLQMETKKSNLIKEMKDIRKIVDVLNNKKDALKEEISKLENRLEVGDSMIAEKKVQLKEKEESIFKKTGDNKDNLDELLQKIIDDIKDIEQKYNLINKSKEENKEEFEALSQKLFSIQGKYQELLLRHEEQKNILNTALEEEKLPSIQFVKENIGTTKELDTLKRAIDEYSTEYSSTKAFINSLKEKLGNRLVTEEEYIGIKKSKDKLQNEVNEKNEIKIKKEEEIKKLKEKMQYLKELIERRGQIEHKIALLRDLEKLFRGKKFVEYIAKNRLNYISKDASKRLYNITNGNYALEVDENSKFIIRDYKNGGVKRDASTLSGGETFLTSFALALSLSAEIQLKGTAPLELFFLDEGFGTLDDNLLEIVMSSLEKIHNDRLKIGIISHVESIKNRTPIKLIVTPAESGIGGSRVKIEKS